MKNRLIWIVGAMALGFLPAYLYFWMIPRAQAALPTPTEIIKTVASAATPEALGASTVASFKTIVFVGNKAARTANTGRVWIQLTSANGSAGIPLLSGQVISITTVARFSPADFYIDVETAADGVVTLLLQ